MPRFVILEHDWPTRHFDLLLEAGDVLRAWRLKEEPELGKTIHAEPNANHRLIYLDYEGPVSGNRGRVKRWGSGSFELIRDESGAVVFDVDTGHTTGRFSLCRDEDGRWRLTWSDPPAESDELGRAVG